MDTDENMPVGKGINQPAVVTLCGIPPLQDQTEDEMAAFLKLKCSEMDSEFISYTAMTGEWKFRVKHF